MSYSAPVVHRLLAAEPLPGPAPAATTASAPAIAWTSVSLACSRSTTAGSAPTCRTSSACSGRSGPRPGRHAGTGAGRGAGRSGRGPRRWLLASGHVSVMMAEEDLGGGTAARAEKGCCRVSRRWPWLVSGALPVTAVMWPPPVERGHRAVLDGDAAQRLGGRRRAFRCGDRHRLALLGRRIVGRADFVALQERYPTTTGRWTFDIHRLVTEGRTTVSEVTVTDGRSRRGDRLLRRGGWPDRPARRVLAHGVPAAGGPG